MHSIDWEHVMFVSFSLSSFNCLVRYSATGMPSGYFWFDAERPKRIHTQYHYCTDGVSTNKSTTSTPSLPMLRCVRRYSSAILCSRSRTYARPSILEKVPCTTYDTCGQRIHVTRYDAGVTRGRFLSRSASQNNFHVSSCQGRPPAALQSPGSLGLTKGEIRVKVGRN